MSFTFVRIPAILLCIIISPAFSQPFITTWKSDGSGISDTNQITIPTSGTGYLIEWEEVSDTSNNGSEVGSANHILTFPHSGIYSISISEDTGSFSELTFDYSGDRNKIQTIEQWGNIPWSSLENAYNGCSYIRINATDTPDFSGVTNANFAFSYCYFLNDTIEHWDVSNIEQFNSMFSIARRFNQSLNNWDVSSGVDFGNMFFAADSFNQPLNNWDVSNATHFQTMFGNTESFNQDISMWNVSSGTNFLGMFSGATFNQDITNWNIQNAATLSYMFDGNTEFNQNLGNWDIDSVSSMTGIFDNSGLSRENYDSILIGWSLQNNNESPTLGSENIEYCQSASARDSLIADGWTLVGDNFDC